MKKPNSNKLYVFQWPSNLGGADTKLVNTLPLLSEWMDITVVPNDSSHLLDTKWTRWLNKLRIDYIPVEELPDKSSGFALSMSNENFFTSGLCKKAKEMGLYVIWGSEMMWHHQGEIEAISNGQVDHIAYASYYNRKALSSSYGDIGSTVVGNYINPANYPLVTRENRNFTIGRVSRPDIDKFPVNFPLLYESLTFCKYKVLGWDENLGEYFKWHNFSDNWSFYRADSIPVNNFLKEIDLFVYPLGHKFKESYGRSVVEAMLTGLPVVVPRGHNFDFILKEGEGAFFCDTYEDWYRNVCGLGVKPYREVMGLKAHKWAKEKLCKRRSHVKIWKGLFGKKS